MIDERIDPYRGKLGFIYDNRIVIRQEPDVTRQKYLWFPEGVEVYRLFDYNYVIKSLKRLYYHISVIKWINPDIEYELFLETFDYIADKWSIYHSRDFDYEVVNNIFLYVEKPTPIIKQVIFNEAHQLDRYEKMSIVNDLTKRIKLTKEAIVQAKQLLIAEGKKGTHRELGEVFEVSYSTIGRVLRNEEYIPKPLPLLYPKYLTDNNLW